MWFPERLSLAYEVGLVASVVMHMVESGEFAGWQEYVPATVMAKKKRSRVRNQQIPLRLE